MGEGTINERGPIPQERLVGINPGAADPYRSWPLASFVEVAKFLRASHGVKIFLNASVQEKKMVQEFKELLGDQDFFLLPGKKSLPIGGADQSLFPFYHQ